MEMSKRKLIIVVSLITVLAFLSGYSIPHISMNRKNTETDVDVQYVFETWDGTFIYTDHNVITNNGEKHTRNAFSRGNEENATKLAVGNVTGNLQIKTTLDDVYNDPTDGSYIEGTIVEWESSGDSAYNCTYKWTFEETVRLDAAALYIGNTTFVYALANFPGGAQTFSSGENLTVRWTPVYDAND